MFCFCSTIKCTHWFFLLQIQFYLYRIPPISYLLCSGDKPFTCELCHKDFARSAALRIHKISVHSDVKSYLCADCGAAFKANSALIDHRKRVHLQIKPHKYWVYRVHLTPFLTHIITGVTTVVKSFSPRKTLASTYEHTRGRSRTNASCAESALAEVTISRGITRGSTGLETGRQLWWSHPTLLGENLPSTVWRPLWGKLRSSRIPPQHHQKYNPVMLMSNRW